MMYYLNLNNNDLINIIVSYLDYDLFTIFNELYPVINLNVASRLRFKNRKYDKYSYLELLSAKNVINKLGLHFDGLYLRVWSYDLDGKKITGKMIDAKMMEIILSMKDFRNGYFEDKGEIRITSNIITGDNVIYKRKDKISLSDIDSISHSMSNLTELKYLDYKTINKEYIDDSICYFINLKEINLDAYWATSLPSCINKMSSLEKLILNNNSFDHFGDQISHLTNLKELSIYNNPYLTQLDESIGYLTNLESLILTFCKLTKLPDSISHLPDLKYLDISSNNLQELTGSIVYLSSLTKLNLNNMQRKFIQLYHNDRRKASFLMIPSN